MKACCTSSLRGRLTLLIVLSMLPILGLTVFTYRNERSLALMHIEDDVRMISNFASSTQEKVIETTRQLLLALSGVPQVRDLDDRKCSSYLSDILDESPGYINIGTILPDGNTSCSAIPISGPTNFSDQPWFQSSIAHKGFAISSYRFGDGVEKPVLYFGYPLFDDSKELKVVLFAAVDFSQLDQLALQVHLPKLSEILMVSGDGKILAYSAGPERHSGNPLPDARVVDSILAKGRGVLEIKGSDGIERLYAFTPLNSTVETGLYVSIAVPTAIVYSEVNEVLMYHFIGLGLITILALSAVWIGSHVFIIRPINVLVDAAKRLSRLEMGARTGLPQGRGELDQLAGAFDDMAETLEHRTLNLQEAETRYRTLVEQLPVITYTARMDGDRSSLYISPQVREILGFTPDEWLAGDRLWLKQMHPDDVEEVLSSLNQCYARSQPFQSEYRIHSREGKLLWVSDEAVAVCDPAGNYLYLLGIIRDITEERLAEEKLLEYQRQLRSLASQLSLAEERERRRIAVDLHDRVGQTLALSRIRLEMLKQSASSSHYAEPIEEIRELIIQAIRDTRSLIFKISSPVLYELGIEAALEWLAEQTQKEHDIIVKCESDRKEKVLDNDVRGFLFRAVSELLVNVTKHSKARQATISVTRDGGFVRISVWDDGIGFDTSRAGYGYTGTDGFGLFSIRERLDHVQGFMKIESNPGKGTRITLLAPLKCGTDSENNPE